MFAGLIIGKKLHDRRAPWFWPLLGQGISRFSGRRRHNWSIFLKFAVAAVSPLFFGGLTVLVWSGRFIRGGDSRYRRGFDTIYVLGSLAGVVGTYAILIPLTIVNHWPIEYLLYAFWRHRDDYHTHRAILCVCFKASNVSLGERAEKIRRHPNR